MNKSLLLVAAIAAFSGTAAFASTPSKSDCSTCTTPVPVYVVHPTELPSEAFNRTVNLAMDIDAQGVPHAVHPAGIVDRRIAERLKMAVSQWRFRPQYVNGQAVSTRVILPVTLVDEDDTSVRLATAGGPASQAN